MTARNYYVVDAFTTQLYGGNPAAVCPLEAWLPDATMQQIAAENNLSETVFYVPEGDHYRIRWFTPAVEVKLCGHATLATAHVFYTQLGYDKPELRFDSLSGMLVVTKTANGYQLDFPANPPEVVEQVPAGLFEGLRISDAPVYKTSFDYMVVLPTEAMVAALNPDFNTLAQVPARGVIVTARGNEADFVSRCFYPQSGVNEDPVTGSAHTIMIPYWAQQLKKNKMQSIQLSKRRGYLDVELVGDRALMRGTAVLYAKGEYYTA